MPVHGSQAELAHTPRLARQRLDDFRASRTHPSIVGISIVHDEVTEVRVITELSGGENIGALAGHDPAAVAHEHAPARVADLSNLEAEHVAIEGARSRQIRDGEHEEGAADGHRASASSSFLRTADHSARMIE